MIREESMTADEVRSMFNFNQRTGSLNWAKNFHKSRVGCAAGSLTKEGYLEVRIQGRSYRSHRLVWIYVTGQWPKLEIDHINRDPSDNRFENLREVTTAQNQHNQAFTGRKGKSGLLGAHFNAKAKRWQSSIIVNKQAIYLGLFDTPELAHAAYCSAKQIHHPSNPMVVNKNEMGI